jgi:diacylglycerol kinase (ATP)
MKLALIMNPHSGGCQRRPELAEQIRTLLRSRQLDAQLWLTEGPGHATTLARAAVADGCDRVIAIGGDGTFNEVALPLIGTPTALGLIPCGSGNGLGRHLGMHRSISWVLELVTDPHARILAIDTGTVNGRPFCNVMGTGFDAEIGHRFNQLERRGVLPYAYVTAGSLRRMHVQRCTITSDEDRLVLDTLMVTVANSAQYGNHALIAPGAEVADGWLDLVVIKPLTVVHATLLLPRLFLGNLTGSTSVLHRRIRQVVIERPAPGLVHTDGETFQTDARLEIAVRPRSLQLIVPSAASAGAPRAPAPVEVGS